MTILTALPLLILIDWLWTCLLAIPVWLLWTVCGLGARYFGFLPQAWLSMPLLHMLGLFLLLAIGRTAAPRAKAELKA